MKRSKYSDMTVDVVVADGSPAKKGVAAEPGDGGDNGRGSFRGKVTRLALWLDTPTHCSTIAVFRIMYALCVLAQLAKWDGMFTKFSRSILVLPYPGFSWIRAVSPETGFVLISVCRVASFCQLVGFFTPISTAVAWLTFTWLFNECESNFNNHYILMCHMLFLGMFLQWGNWLSVDRLIGKLRGRPVDPHVPHWNLLLLRIIMTVPYLYGAFAKMNPDWLFRAEPVTMWFKPRGGLYSHPLFPWFICWSGMLYDLLIGFILFYRPTRYLLGFPGAIMFNSCNKIMFNIGVFPLMMICSLTLFLEPNVPARLLSWITKTNVEESAVASKPLKPVTATGHWGLSRKQWFGVIFVVCFLTFHSLFPFREKLIYPGNPSWHEEGHFGAWHMKLRTKTGYTHLNLIDSKGDKFVIDPSRDPYIHGSQNKYFMKPHCLILYVNRLKQIFEAAGNPLQSVTATSCYSLNARSAHHLYKSDANLLHFVGKYELMGVSGARQSPNHPSKWIWRDEEGPACDRHGPKLTTETRAALGTVYEQAGITFRSAVKYEKARQPGTPKGNALMWKHPGQEEWQYAYTYPMVD